MSVEISIQIQFCTMKQLVNLAAGNHNYAYLYILVGNLTLAAWQVMFKNLTQYVTPFQGVALRSFIVTMINMFLVRRQQKSTYIKSRTVFLRIIARVLTSCFSYISMFYSLRYLPVSTVSTVFNTGPIFIFFIQAFHYKNTLHFTNFLLTFVSFVGVVLMVQPDFIFGADSEPKQSNYYVFIGVMICSAFANALNLHFVHGLAKVVDPIVNMFYSHLGLTLCGAVLNNFEPTVMNPANLNTHFIALVLAVGILGAMSQNLIFLANCLKKPSDMMPFGYVGVAAGFLADIYLFNTSFSFMTIVGVFLTSGGLLSGFLLHKEHKQHVVTKQEVKEIQMAQQNEDILLSLDSSQQGTPQK